MREKNKKQEYCTGKMVFGGACGELQKRGKTIDCCFIQARRRRKNWGVLGV